MQRDLTLEEDVMFHINRITTGHVIISLLILAVIVLPFVWKSWNEKIIASYPVHEQATTEKSLETLFHNAPRGSLILERDGTMLYVHYGKNGKALVSYCLGNTCTSVLRPDPILKVLHRDFLEIILPTDDRYPEMAAKFLSRGSWK